MKKLFALLLSIVMTLALAVPALAAPSSEAVTPTPPSWVSPEEYAVFEGGKAYEPENWATILELRKLAEAGGLEPTREGDIVLYNRFRSLQIMYETSVTFELALLGVRYAYNAAVQGNYVRITAGAFDSAGFYATQERTRYLCYLWNVRRQLWNADFSGGLSGQGLPLYSAAYGQALRYPQFTLERMLDCDLLRLLPAEKLEYVRSLLFVTLDGNVVHPRAVRYSRDNLDTTTAHIRYDRTMVPVRRLAELIGAEVSYDGTTRQVTMKRAGNTIQMTIGQRIARKNGTAFEMDVAPYIENGRTYVPIRYIAEFFGQSVVWRAERRQVDINEDKAAAAPSNLETWALPMGAMLSYLNRSGNVDVFGGKTRFGTAPVGSAVSNKLETTGADLGRQTLSKSWDISSREALITTVCSMTLHGHNDSFFEAVEIGNALTPTQYNEIISKGGVDAYMFPYTKQLSEKWGDRGILCWDLFRMSNLVQWGYLAGYVTYPEALALLEPAAKLLRENFSSWDEAYENYLDGYQWWLQIDGRKTDVWKTERGQAYLELKKDPNFGPLFDNTLFQTGVIPVPGVTAAQLLQSVLGD